MTLPVAVRTLREASGLSQQAFADRVGLSIRAIANYEKDRPPSARSLLQFAKLASQLSLPDLSAVFSKAFQAEVGDAVIDVTDDLSRSALIAVHENNRSEWLDGQLLGLLKRARKGEPLAYPIILDGNRVPNQNARIEYIESLLVQLRMRSAASAAALLDEMAEERSQQTDETPAAAYLEILKNNPELYARYNQERADAARGTSHEPSLATYGTRQHAARKTKNKRSKK